MVWAQSRIEHPQNCGQRCEQARWETSLVLSLWLVHEDFGPWGLHSRKGFVLRLATEGFC